MLSLANKLSLSTSKIAPSGFSDDFSIELDGTNDHLADADFPRNVLADEFSVSAWIKLDVSAGNRVAVGGWSDAQTFTLRALTTTGYAQFGIRTSNNAFKKVSNTTDMAGDWAHMVGTFKRNEYVKLYVDGALIGSQAVADFELQLTDSDSDNSGTADNGIAIGSNADDNLANFFDGNVNDVGIWSTELSAADITSIYNSGTPTDLLAEANSAALEGYWKMEENTGTTAYDSSGNGRDMVLTSGASFSSETP